MAKKVMKQMDVSPETQNFTNVITTKNGNVQVTATFISALNAV